MGDHGQCLACKYLRRPCSEGCPYIQLFSTYFDAPKFQIGYAASIADIQKIEARITDSTLTFEANAGVNEPLVGATGILLALHQRMREEVTRFETITGKGVNVIPAGTMNHVILKDSEKIEQQHRACPACTYLPQKCKVDCPFVPFFEARKSRDFIREFCTVLCGSTAVLPDHSNLQSADELNKAGITAKALEFESKARVHDPVYGITGIILSLYKNWWNLNHHVRLLEQRHRSVQNFPTVQIGSCNIPTDKGKGNVTPESTNECCTIAEWMDMEDDDESLYSREENVQGIPLLSQPWGALVQGIPLRISENVPQNVPSQLQRQLSAPYIQQSTSSSLRAPTSSSQRMSSTGRALQRASTPQQREAWGQLLGRPPVQHIPQNVPSELQQLAAPSHSQQAASSSLREAPSSQQGMSSTTGEAINRAWQNLTRQEREELLRQTWNRLPDTSHVQNLVQRFPDRPSVQDILQRTSQRVPHSVIPQLQQQLAAPSHGQLATSSSLRAATSSQQGTSSSTGTPPTSTTDTI
ncbi:uncharacterized protein LOC113280977 [Papaver somniferum]|uniref:uncharacterized protein LOC113280977 n=1 Tax=Papaver somniferum TaxID=3469 RepID=UPI000E6FF94F|nr:uncharacterized protein LOC113280977 [Papaver somniferum]